MSPTPKQIAAARADGEIGFRAAIYAMVCCIPDGRVAGYGHVAAWIGHPRAARQVGFALSALEPGSTVPWWRVLRSSGQIALQGDPSRGPRQAQLLAQEGVQIKDWRVSMNQFAWSPS